MSEGFAFQLHHTDGDARVGVLCTPHGHVDTPAFMSVATYGAVRGVAFSELEAIGAQILLSNTYHLHERPGEDLIARHGGLHGFTGWRRPWLTDSGGFQVTSLSHRARVSDEGVDFASPVDGRRRMLTPETAVAIQESLGSDIAMALDECVPASTGDAADGLRLERAMERTLRWAERARAARQRADQALFGIVQGGTSERLRQRSARATAEIGFDGYAHGGLGLGEDRHQRVALVAAVHSALPRQAPRYLMGLGKPSDLLDGVAAGIDLFDCVLPSRNGRHGLLFTRRGPLRIRNARFRSDDCAIEEECDCPTCAGTSRAYLSHLVRVNEALGARLATLHNLRFYLRLLEDARRAIAEGHFEAFRRRMQEAWSEPAA